jgi:predicted N-formylglutamate amidohydrolase
MTPSFIITCEHAGNIVPDEYAAIFYGQDEILTSHRGWDPGALQVAEFLSERLQCALFTCSITRLLIETNRSLDSEQLFSEFSVKLNEKNKSDLLNDIYFSYRGEIEYEINSLPKPVIHLSSHSFTPVWNGQERMVDIGILFDPSRLFEKAFCEAWRNNLLKILPEKIILFNEPYQGTDDGFTTYLRTKNSDANYAGIEIEVNQKYADTNELVRIQAALINALPV